jgi:hypothetical protein
MVEKIDDLFEDIGTQVESTNADRVVGGRGPAERQRRG